MDSTKNWHRVGTVDNMKVQATANEQKSEEPFSNGLLAGLLPS
jgi:hypothetical protein